MEALTITHASRASARRRPGAVSPPAREGLAGDDVPRVLVVDDYDVNRRILRAILARDGYELVEAADGAAALAAAIESAPDLVLLDIMMPGMDGYEVCARLKRDPRLADTPVIFLSALDDAESKVRGFEAGAVDYVAKPFDNAEVLARVRTHLNLRRLNRELQAANVALIEKKAALDADLEAAADIQRTLIPRRPPWIPGMSFAWRFRPCDRSGGDVFDLLPLDADHLALYIVDVSGHGVGAAMITVSVVQSLRPESGLVVGRSGGEPRIASPSEVLAQLDRDYPVERFGRHFTIWYGVLNHREGWLRYSGAGHPPPLLLRRGQTRALDARGTIIGLGGMLPFEEEAVELRRCDRLYLYSDGIVERSGEDGETFGEERLGAALARGSGLALDESCAAAIDAVESFARGAAAEDDVTLVAAEYGAR